MNCITFSSTSHLGGQFRYDSWTWTCCFGPVFCNTSKMDNSSYFTHFVQIKRPKYFVCKGRTNRFPGVGSCEEKNYPHHEDEKITPIRVKKLLILYSLDYRMNHLKAHLWLLPRLVDSKVLMVIILFEVLFLFCFCFCFF